MSLSKTEISGEGTSSILPYRDCQCWRMRGDSVTSFLANSFRLEQLHPGHLQFSQNVPLSTVTLPLRKCSESMCKCMSVREREAETENLRKIRYESQFKQASFWVASRLNSFTSVWHPQGLIPLTTLPRSALTMPGDVRDVESVSTDVNVVCVVLKSCDDVKSSTCKLHTCLNFTQLITQDNMKLLQCSSQLQTLWFQVILCVPHCECSDVATKATRTFPFIPMHTWLTSKC